MRARAALGERDRVVRAVGEALTLPAGITHPVEVAWTAAQELDTHGHAGTGARVRETALDWLTAQPRPSRLEQRLRVRLLLESERIDDAVRALSDLEPLDDLESVGLAGLVRARAGDAAPAHRLLGSLESIESPYISGRHLLLAAGIRAILDPPRTGIATLRRAFAAGLPFTVELHALPMLRPLAADPELRALLEPRA